MGVTAHWLSPAAVVPQQTGTDWLDRVDNEPWSEGRGFYRGFSTSFAVREGREMWFHWPFQLGAGSRITGFELLWEAEAPTRIGWTVWHHGGAERHELTARHAKVAGEPVAFDPPEAWRQYYPPMHRHLTRFSLPAPVETCFGVQLCVMATGGGTIRFYGAAVDTA